MQNKRPRKFKGDKMKEKVIYKPIRVSSVNIRSKLGNKARKDRVLEPGRYKLIREFKSNGLATHGTPVYELEDKRGYLYHIEKKRIE